MAAGTPPQDGHHVKRVVLPSGKTIEVVYFDSRGEETALPSVHHELHVCQDCSSELVYPTAWEEAGPEYWRVTLRCPNCEWVTRGVFPQDLVDRFDTRLDEGTEEMMADLNRLLRANMSEEIESFVAALEVDAVLPEDF
jgi:hypothetical protein